MAVEFLSKHSPETKPPQVLQSQSLELVTIVIVINVVIGEFNGETHVTVRLQLCRLIRTKFRTLCINHICGNCNCND